jgi:hypothetical protein
VWAVCWVVACQLCVHTEGLSSSGFTTVRDAGTQGVGTACGSVYSIVCFGVVGDIWVLCGGWWCVNCVILEGMICRGLTISAGRRCAAVKGVQM